MTIRFTALAAAATLLAAPAWAQSSQDELQEALVGNTFQGDMGSSGYASYFAEDGMYHDSAGSGSYEITDEGVCYPETDFGCYQAEIEGENLQWMQDGEDMGSGVILDGDALDLTQE